MPTLVSFYQYPFIQLDMHTKIVFFVILLSMNYQIQIMVFKNSMQFRVSYDIFKLQNSDYAEFEKKIVALSRFLRGGIHKLRN